MKSQRGDVPRDPPGTECRLGEGEMPTLGDGAGLPGRGPEAEPGRRTGEDGLMGIPNGRTADAQEEMCREGRRV